MTSHGDVIYRSRDHLVPHGPFPISGSLKRSLYLQPFSRYWALSIGVTTHEFDLSGSRDERFNGKCDATIHVMTLNGI